MKKTKEKVDQNKDLRRHFKYLLDRIKEFPEGSDERKELAVELKETGALLNEAEKNVSDNNNQKKERVCKFIIAGVEIVIPVTVYSFLWILGLGFEKDNILGSRMMSSMVSNLVGHLTSHKK